VHRIGKTVRYRQNFVPVGRADIKKGYVNTGTAHSMKLLVRQKNVNTSKTNFPLILLLLQNRHRGFHNHHHQCSY